MRDIDKLCSTFDDLKIEYTRRAVDEYEYVFVGECRNMHNLKWDFKTTDLESLVMSHKFYEFKNGDIASYSNS